MFIDQLLILCEKENIKLTTLMKQLDLSTGNIKRWKDGATVKSDILIKFAEYFNVSCDYLLTGKDNMPQSATISLREDEEHLLEMYNSLTELKKRGNSWKT